MESLSMQLQPFFEWLLRTTLQASLLICLILLFQVVLRSRLGARWHYCLWLLLLIRMAMPWAPQSRVSMFNLIPQSLPQRQTEYIQQDVGDDAVSSDAASPSTAESTPVSTIEVAQDTSKVITVAPEIGKEAQGWLKPVASEIAAILPLVWLTGALVLAVYVCANNFNLLRIVKRERPLTNQKILDLLEDCKAEMGIRIILGVVATDKVNSPALFGFIRPRLLLPKGMLETLSREELRYVFLHELAHLKRHDIYIGWLISLLQVLHWFNPLIWLAFYRVRADRELACDALVLARTQSGQAKDYGRTIVNLLERFSRSQRLPAMAGILETKTQLKRRITMIARFKKNSYQWSPLAVVLIIVLGCVALPDAKHTKASGISSAKPESAMTLRKIRDDWGRFANLSPDGKYVSDVDWDTGNLVVWELATGKVQPLTSKGSWKNEYPESPFHSVISPNSKRVAYQGYYTETATFNLYIVGLDGSGRRILRQNEHIVPRDWSPDGKKILAILFDKDANQMVWVSASDGTVQAVKTFGKASPSNVDLSPDGRYIAYTLNGDIFLFAIEENREIPLVQHPANDKLLGWTPDGKYVFFTSDRRGAWDAWLLQVAGGEPQGFPEIVKLDIGNVTPIGFTQNGSYYYRNEQGLHNVFVATLDLETGKVLSPPIPVRQTGATTCHDWSPDGQYLAYCTRSPDKSQIIHIRTLATSQERTLANNLPYFRYLRWSLDGQSILVTGFVGDPHEVICKIDVQTGERTDLVRSETEVLLRPELSPDGKTLFYIRGDPVSKTARLVARDLKTGREKDLFRVVPPTRFGVGGLFALSPDGQRLVLSTGLRSRPRTTYPVAPALKIVSAAGGEPKELLQFEEEKMFLSGVAWTPDSQDVLFAKMFFGGGKGGKEGELWRISAAGGEPRKLWVWKKQQFGRLRVHPDGRCIAFHSGSTPNELWLMENFLPTGEGNER